MDRTDLDWLCEDASPEEVKRLMRLVHEWSQGDEQSFPVQLALLTRAQWRAAAMIPKLVDESRKLTELKLADYRQQAAALVQNFSDTADDKAEALSAIVTAHTKSINQAVANVQAQLTSAENVAALIRSELESGALVWKQAKADYEAEWNKLDKLRRELDALNHRHDWLWFTLILLGMIGIGIATGMVISQLQLR